MTGKSCTIVIPCFDEADRFDRDRLGAFAAAHAEIGFILVDDGSRDGTRGMLEDLARRQPESFAVLALDGNRGKAEAVRQGLLQAFDREGVAVGFWDADLSTPLEEIPAFARALDQEGVEAVFGTRLKLLGRQVERSAWRHYLGRVYATFASLVLGLGVYDTQCGAKLFRRTAANQAVFARPFITRWLFDVEILARMIEDSRSEPARHPDRAVLELPLASWRDVAGSKVRARDGLRALVDLVRIRRFYALRTERDEGSGC